MNLEDASNQELIEHAVYANVITVECANEINTLHTLWLACTDRILEMKLLTAITLRLTLIMERLEYLGFKV